MVHDGDDYKMSQNGKYIEIGYLSEKWKQAEYQNTGVVQPI